jgi:hypothetical protein
MQRPTSASQVVLKPDADDMPVFFILSQTFGKLSAQNGIAIQFLLPNHAPAISVSAGDWPFVPANATFRTKDV